MKAMLSTAVGGPETLELTEMEVPQPKKGQVLVRIHAAGLNFPDTLMIRDMYQIKPPRPFPPGGEISGEVLEVKYFKTVKIKIFKLIKTFDLIQHFILTN